MNDTSHIYPILLERTNIESLIPHRGDIFFCQRLLIEGPHDYKGVARWPLDNGIIKGHFPGLPLVPGVMIIETAAQLAGAGMLMGDPYLKTLPDNLVGVLASVRNCRFKQPALPDSDVEFAIHCRQMAPLLVQVTAAVTTGDIEVAQLEILIAYAPRKQLLEALARNESVGT